MIWIYLFVIVGSLFFTLQVVTRYRCDSETLHGKLLVTVQDKTSVDTRIQENGQAVQAAVEQGDTLDAEVGALEKTSGELRGKLDAWAARNERMGKVKVKRS